MMIRIERAFLEAQASERPAGYVEDILQSGTPDGTAVLLDERTYRRLQWKYNPKGFGDVVARWVSEFGIDRAVEMIEQATGIPCGCADRQNWLNEQFPSS